MSGKHKYSESLLFGASLSPLGSTGVVSNEAPEAHGHCRVTVIHSHHSHLLSRGPMGNSQSANVWLQKVKGTCHIQCCIHMGFKCWFSQLNNIFLTTPQRGQK